LLQGSVRLQYGISSPTWNYYACLCQNSLKYFMKWVYHYFYRTTSIINQGQNHGSKVGGKDGVWEGCISPSVRSVNCGTWGGIKSVQFQEPVRQSPQWGTNTVQVSEAQKFARPGELVFTVVRAYDIGSKSLRRFSPDRSAAPPCMTRAMNTAPVSSSTCSVAPWQPNTHDITGVNSSYSIICGTTIEKSPNSSTCS